MLPRACSNPMTSLAHLKKAKQRAPLLQQDPIEGYGGSHMTLGVYADTSIEDAGVAFPKQYILKKDKLFWSGNWIDWESHKTAIYNILPYGPPVYNFESIAGQIEDDHDFYSEVCRFLIALHLWETTPGEKVHTAWEVWVKCLLRGPAYEDELDDLFSEWRFETRDSYNSVFPCRFLIRWKHGCDDYLWSLEETHGSEEYFEAFRAELKEVLSEVPDVEFPDDTEILYERSTTTSFIYSAKRKMPHWEASLYYPDYFEEERFKGIRAIVQVYPGSTRDAVIADKASNNSVRWVERAMRSILEYVPESGVTKYVSTFERRRSKVVYRKGYHVLRDIKKCGLTYNVREIFPIICEELIARFNEPRFKRMLIFLNRDIYNEDMTEVFHPLRGYCLGMANHVVTLANAVIARVAMKELVKQYKVSVSSVVCNDDSDMVCFYGRGQSGTDAYLLEAARTLQELENNFQDGLGNLINIKKTVVKPFGLFLEEYDLDGWRNKEALVCNALACAYCAGNIREAKHYIASQSERFFNPWAKARLLELAAFWGPEFLVSSWDEVQVNYEVGGWLNTQRKCLKTTLTDIEDLLRKGYSKELLARILMICQKFVEPPRPRNTHPGYVSNFRYSGQSTDVNPKYFQYTLTKESLIDYYKRLTTFQKNYASRIRSFYRIIGRSKPKPLEYYIKRLMLHPWYCIPEEAVLTTITGIWDKDYDVQWENNVDYDDTIVLDEEVLDRLSSYKHSPSIRDPICWITINANDEIVISCSQFSNTGILPAFEYFRRTGSYPICRYFHGRFGDYFRSPKPEDLIFGQCKVYRYIKVKKSKPTEDDDSADTESASSVSTLPQLTEQDIVAQAKDILEDFGGSELDHFLAMHVKTNEEMIDILDSIVHNEDALHQGFAHLLGDALGAELGESALDESDESFDFGGMF